MRTLLVNFNSDKIMQKKEMESHFEIYYFLKAYRMTVQKRNPNDILI